MVVFTLWIENLKKVLNLTHAQQKKLSIVYAKDMQNVADYQGQQFYNLQVVAESMMGDVHFKVQIEELGYLTSIEKVDETTLEDSSVEKYLYFTASCLHTEENLDYFLFTDIEVCEKICGLLTEIGQDKTIDMMDDMSALTDSFIDIIKQKILRIKE